MVSSHSSYWLNKGYQARTQFLLIKLYGTSEIWTGKIWNVYLKSERAKSETYIWNLNEQNLKRLYEIWTINLKSEWAKSETYIWNLKSEWAKSETYIWNLNEQNLKSEWAKSETYIQTGFFFIFVVKDNLRKLPFSLALFSLFSSRYL